MGKTVILDNKNYVYIHKNKITGEIFYVGKGRDKRAYSKHKRSIFWNSYVNKYKGFEVEIVKCNLTEEESFDLEIKLIKKYGRKDLGKGTLVNLTDGGEGASGNIHSEESKEKVSQNHARYWLDKEVPLEMKGRISETLKGRYRGGESPHAKKLINIDSGIIYNSMMDASEDLGISNKALWFQLNRAKNKKVNIEYYG